eukprot:1160502-Pelagomonas_calceolata.AAC.1
MVAWAKASLHDANGVLFRPGLAAFKVYLTHVYTEHSFTSTRHGTPLKEDGIAPYYAEGKEGLSGGRSE